MLVVMVITHLVTTRFSNGYSRMARLLRIFLKFHRYGGTAMQVLFLS